MSAGQVDDNSPLGVTLPGGWRVAEIAEIAEKIGSGATPRGGASVYLAAGTTFIRSQNVFDHRFSDDGLVYINDAEAKKLTNVRVRKHDVLLNITGDGETIARCCVVPERVLPARVNQHVVIIRPSPLIVPEYLQRYLSLPKIRAYMLSHNSGASRRALTKSQIEKFRVVIPPLSEQRAIAEVLGALDDKIAANTSMSAVADELAVSLVEQSYDLVSTERLVDIAEIVMGSSPPGQSLNELGDGTVFYQGVRDFGFRHPSRRIWTTRPVRMAELGDCLLSVRAPVGLVNVADEVTCIGRGIAAIRSRQDTPYTLFHLLRNAKAVWAPFSGEGTIFGSINRPQLENVTLRAIERSCKERLEKQLEAIETHISSIQSENRSLAKTRDMLLPLLMSGKLHVKDAEKQIEEIV